MTLKIVIYQDEGVGEFGLSCLQKFFSGDDVRVCGASGIIERSALNDADIFIMPGGADLPYCKKLDGAGNKNIRGFVENGGTYLGICAGAYYACTSLEFHKGRTDEICGTRELGLIDAAAIGSIPELAPPYDLTLASAAAIGLKSPETSAYYHGGPYFRLQDPAAKVLAYYDLPFPAPAIIAKKIGKGTAILSGIHFEVLAEDLRAHPEDPARANILADAFDTVFDWRSFLLGETLLS